MARSPHYRRLGQAATITKAGKSIAQTVAKKLEAKKQADARKRIAAARKRIEAAKKTIATEKKRQAAAKKKIVSADAAKQRAAKTPIDPGLRGGRRITVRPATPTKTKKPLPTLGSLSSKPKKPKNGYKPSRQSQRKQR